MKHGFIFSKRFRPAQGADTRRFVVNRRKFSLRLGIAIRFSVIIALFLILLFGGMLFIISNTLNRDFYELQTQEFSTQLTAIQELVNFQSSLVKKVLVSNILNADFIKGFQTGEDPL